MPSLESTEFYMYTATPTIDDGSWFVIIIEIALQDIYGNICRDDALDMLYDLNLCYI